METLVTESSSKSYISTLINFTRDMSFLQRKIVLILADIILINLALFFSLSVKYGITISLQFIGRYWYHSFILTTIILIIFSINKLYSSLWRYASVEELIYVIKACLVSSLITIIALSIARDIDSVTTSLIFLSASTISIGGVRFSYRLLRRAMMGIRSEKIQSSRVMVIGSGKAGSIVLNELFSPRDLLFLHLVCFLCRLFRPLAHRGLEGFLLYI